MTTRRFAQRKRQDQRQRLRDLERGLARLDADLSMLVDEVPDPSTLPALSTLDSDMREIHSRLDDLEDRL